jgi:hypothetical protein
LSILILHKKLDQNCSLKTFTFNLSFICFDIVFISVKILTLKLFISVKSDFAVNTKLTVCFSQWFSRQLTEGRRVFLICASIIGPNRGWKCPSTLMMEGVEIPKWVIYKGPFLPALYSSGSIMMPMSVPLPHYTKCILLPYTFNDWICSPWPFSCRDQK